MAKAKTKDISATELDKSIIAKLALEGLAPSPPPDDNVVILPTGFSSFDMDVLQIGGIPMGRFIEIYGASAVGKSLLAQRLIYQAQKRFPDKVAVYIDTEARFTKQWAIKQGIETTKLQYHRINVIEEIGELINKYVRTKAVSIIVLDSLGNSLVQAHTFIDDYYKKVNNAYKSEQPAALAKQLTRILQQVTMPVADNNVCVVVVNQLRNQFVMYGDPTTTPGGNAFGHDLSLRIELRGLGKSGILEENKEQVGQMVRAVVKKNSLGLVGQTNDDSHLKFYYEDGPAKTERFSTLEDAIRRGVVVKSAGWYGIYDPDSGEKVDSVNGIENLSKRILDDDVFYKALISYCKKVKSDGVFGEPITELHEELIPESDLPELPELQGAQ